MRKLVPLLAATLAACAALPPAPQTPSQAVYELEASYVGALALAVQYKNLPACAGDGVVICSDSAVVARLRTANAIASPALDAAEAAVQGGGPDGPNALALAAQAVQAFISITSGLPHK